MFDGKANPFSTKEYAFSTASQKVSVVAAIQHPYHNPQQFEVPWNVAGIDTGGGRGGHAHGGGPPSPKSMTLIKGTIPSPPAFLLSLVRPTRMGGVEKSKRRKLHEIGC